MNKVVKGDLLVLRPDCPNSQDGKHHADPLSGSFPQEADSDEFLHFVVDFNCKHCGLSGSVRVDPT